MKRPLSTLLIAGLLGASLALPATAAAHDRHDYDGRPGYSHYDKRHDRRHERRDEYRHHHRSERYYYAPDVRWNPPPRYYYERPYYPGYLFGGVELHIDLD